MHVYVSFWVVVSCFEQDSGFVLVIVAVMRLIFSLGLLRSGLGLPALRLSL
jgi:hypothetical protein